MKRGSFCISLFLIFILSFNFPIFCTNLENLYGVNLDQGKLLYTTGFYYFEMAEDGEYGSINYDKIESD